MYRKTIIASIVMVLALVFLNVSTSQAFWGPDRVEKAEEALQAEMPEKAIDLLEKEVDKDPSNAKAHYKLGVAYLQKCDGKTHKKVGFSMIPTKFSHAIKRFSSAISLNPSYRSKVKEKLFSTAMDSLKKGDVKNARRIAKYTKEHLELNISDRIANILVRRGESLLQQGTFSQAEKHFEVAEKFGKSQAEIAQIYVSFTEEEGVSPKMRARLYGAAKNFDQQYEDEYGRALLERAKTVEDGEQKGKLVKKALEYIPTEGKTEWRKVLVINKPKEMERIYDGDKFRYKSPHAFKVIDEEGKAYRHNPTSGGVRSFHFYNVPQGGEKIFVKPADDKGEFYLEYQIVRAKKDK